MPMLCSQPAREACCAKKNGVMAYLYYKQTNFRNVFSNYPRTIPGLLTLFYLSPFDRKTQFKMAVTCTDYYDKNGISSPVTMQIVNAIYGFVCLEGQGI